MAYLFWFLLMLELFPKKRLFSTFDCINVMKVIRIKGRRDLDDPELGSSGTQTIKVDLIRFN